MTDYRSAAEVFAAIDTLQADVDARLGALLQSRPSSVPFVSSARASAARHARERERLRRRLRVPPVSAASAAGAADASLPALREAHQALVHAHAEGLPALGDAHAVDRLAVHMVDLAAELAVLDLWLEAEQGDA